MFGVTMDWLAAHPLSAAAGTLVVDRTQLDGWYDVDLRYRPDASHGDHRDLATEITKITKKSHEPRQQDHIAGIVLLCSLPL